MMGNEMTQIPDAAVQAALEYYDEGGCAGFDNYERMQVVKAIITAAIPHLPLGYEVKKLEWETMANDHYAQGCGAQYNIYETMTNLWNAVVTSPKNMRLATNVSLEQAKSAAQADFVRRVRECHVPVNITKSSGCVFNDLGIAKPVEVLDDASMQAKVSEIGNQIHNLGCEYQNDEALSDRLRELRDQLWDISKNYTKPVDVAAVRRQASKEAYWQAEDILTKERTKRHKQYDDYTGENYTQKERYRVAVQVLNIVIKEIRALSAEPAQGEP